MDIHLCDLNSKLCDAWRREFEDVELDRINVYNGDFRDLEEEMKTWSGIVSPANSFGFMNGGIDGIYTQYFGQQLQESVQSLIRSRHKGELLVGRAEAIAIHGDSKFNYLICAPTMRVPLGVENTANVYLATRAALTTDAGLSSILFPGMGTGAGQMPVDECARAMRRAYDWARGPVRLHPRSLTEATYEHIRDCGK